MKYIILIGDGMSDNPIERLGGKTTLQAACTPMMDRIAMGGEFGLFSSVPEGYPPGSDVANLSILGYAPAKYYTGRAPLEAASIGVELAKGDVAFRCNLVTIGGGEEGRVMADYSAGHISTEEAAKIIATLDKEFKADGVRFYTGTSYRHLMVWADGKSNYKMTPPHDISDQVIAPEHLPTGDGVEMIMHLMERSVELLKDHPVNEARRAAGKNTADCIWLWGQGRAPRMPTFKDSYNISGGIISAVDLMKGIGIFAGLEVIEVEGVTGYIDTNYKGKAEAALDSLDRNDFVCVHVEAPDEAGHQGKLEDKLQAIEDFDAKIVAPVFNGAVDKFGADGFKLMVITDHPTPVELKTHTSDAVPFAIYGGGEPSGLTFSEVEARKSSNKKTEPGEFIKEFLCVEQDASPL
ncbi:Predicted functional analog of homoserine kinase [hydrothermal vent metagenome]|uniref:Predicted functional analog of homoserine kinase n=1 Tax=hydrothermal vent metagenome TaxID=652676 RepID=A0A3B0V6Z6_9ZZZZ